jgi:hypothetical protein
MKKRKYHKRPSLVRRYTAPLRVLPDFLIIGGMRCGTSSLYYDLVGHPDVYPALSKETYFFGQHYRHGMAWYRSYFPSLFLKKLAAARKRVFLTGEATPKYLFDIHAPKRVYEHLPGAKLIALLRNPVDRAFSHYRMRRRSGGEKASFEEALEAEEERIIPDLRRRQEDEHYEAKRYWLCSYKARGVYAEQLERWSRYFKRENMFIVDSETFFKNPGDVHAEVLRFLGLSSWRPAKFGKRNTSKDAAVMADKTRERLIAYFRPHNERLYAWLGRRFQWET